MSGKIRLSCSPARAHRDGEGASPARNSDADFTSAPSVPTAGGALAELSRLSLASDGMSAAARDLSAQLEHTGVLASVRVQLHAAIVASMHAAATSQPPPPPPRALPAGSAPELAAAGLVLDYLRHWGLGNALAVAQLEAAWPEATAAANAAAAAAGARAEASADGGVGGDGAPVKGNRARPLLTALLEERAPEWDWRVHPDARPPHARAAQPSEPPRARLEGRLPAARAAMPARSPPPLPARAPTPLPLPLPAEPIVFSRTHAGGGGERGRLNQDAHFILRRARAGPAASGSRLAGASVGPPDGADGGAPFAGGARARSLVAAGVFDGHGAEHGHVAARAACACVEAALCRRGFVAALEADPAAALSAVFAEANEAAVEAMSLQPGVLRQGTGARSLLLQRAPAGAEALAGGDAAAGGFLDVTDGGTTASLMILLDCRWLYTAAAGDSSGLLLAAAPVGPLDAVSTLAGGAAAAGAPSPGAAAREEGVAVSARGVHAARLWRDHTPLERTEFERMRGLGARFDAPALFVYDVPALFDAGEVQRPIWVLDGPRAQPRVSPREEARARAAGAACKSVRGELSSLVLSPPSERFSQIGLTVTRSLGDAYMQTFGVTHEPEVRALDLLRLGRQGAALGGAGGARELALVVGTDGLWDLWSHERVAQALWRADGRTFGAFCDATAAEGGRKFGGASDDFTAVLIRVPLPYDEEGEAAAVSSGGGVGGH